MRHGGIVDTRPKLQVVPNMAMKEIKLSQLDQFVLPIAEGISAPFFLTVPSVAKRLKVDRQRVYQLIDESTLEGIRLLDEDGDLIKVLVTRRSVNAYDEYRESKASLKRPSFG